MKFGLFQWIWSNSKCMYLLLRCMLCTYYSNIAAYYDIFKIFPLKNVPLYWYMSLCIFLTITFQGLLRAHPARGSMIPTALKGRGVLLCVLRSLWLSSCHLSHLWSYPSQLEQEGSEGSGSNPDLPTQVLVALWTYIQLPAFGANLEWPAKVGIQASKSQHKGAFIIKTTWASEQVAGAWQWLYKRQILASVATSTDRGHWAEG